MSDINSLSFVINCLSSGQAVIVHMLKVVAAPLYFFYKKKKSCFWNFPTGILRCFPWGKPAVAELRYLYPAY